MKDPLFRSPKVGAAVVAVVMVLLLGLTLGTAYAITLRPPIARPKGRHMPFYHRPMRPVIPQVPQTPPDDTDEL